MLLCIDIGNTHTHYGIVDGAGARFQRQTATRQIDHPEQGFGPILASLQREYTSLRGIAFCSVVPDASEKIRRVIERSHTALSVFQLTHEQKLGVPIAYPRPFEIGQDRLANAAGAHALAPGRPAIVIDLGTAVTFDLVTPDGGYEGGIITPGPAMVTRYLHERTAQLPLVTDLRTPITSVIGKSTAEAIRIGAIVGYAGLIQTLLDAVLAEYATRRLPSAEIFLSGGAAQVVEGRLKLPARVVPDLALVGLAAAHALNH